jgi:hypothetical protein
MTLPVFIGIDVAKATLEVAVRPSGEGWQLANEEAALLPLVTRLHALGPQASPTSAQTLSRNRRGPLIPSSRKSPPSWNRPRNIRYLRNVSAPQRAMYGRPRPACVPESRVSRH